MPPGEIPAKEFPKDSVACYLSGLSSTHPAISLLPLPSNPWSSMSALTVVLPTAKALGSLDDSPWGLAPVAQVISPSSASFSPRPFRPGAAGLESFLHPSESAASFFHGFLEFETRSGLQSHIKMLREVTCCIR